ncbi:MAG: hypothetical protein ABFR65_02675 [Pseudomonadota bacterium]
MDLASRPIRVAVIGMDERMINALRLFFQGPCKNRCVLVEEGSAEIGIIDLDAFHGQQICEEYRKRHPDQPIILLSLHETKVENGIFLRKPLKAQGLISALSKTKRYLLPRPELPTQVAEAQTIASTPTKTQEQRIDHPPERAVADRKRKREEAVVPSTHHAAMYLEEQDSKLLVGTAPDIDPDDPQQLTNAQYEPNAFLHSHISRACVTADDRNRCVRIQAPRGSIYLLPDGHSAFLKFSDSQLRTLSAVPIVERSLSVSVLEAGYTLEQDDDSSLINRDTLLWKTTLWASRGRVPVGTRLDIPVYIRRWPNLTRLLLFPNALRIAALWASHPYTLQTTARILAIPQRHVFGFYSAAHALGLASTSQRAVDTLFEPAPLQKNRRHSLFGRILNHLRKN